MPKTMKFKEPKKIPFTPVVGGKARKSPNGKPHMVAFKKSGSEWKVLHFGNKNTAVDVAVKKQKAGLEVKLFSYGIRASFGKLG